MTDPSSKTHERYMISRDDFSILLDTLVNAHYTLVGPNIKDQAIVYDQINGIEDLPIGWTDEQEAGTYRIKPRSDNALFGYNVGPQSWKKFLHLPVVSLWKARKTETGVEIDAPKIESPALAFIGVRSCELAAIEIQDRIFCNDQHPDQDYLSRRNNIFIIAAQCTQAGATCFCTSMNTGPRAKKGFDLAVTELIDSERHDFVLEVGSDTAAKLIEPLHFTPATNSQWVEAKQVSDCVTEQMGRKLDTIGIKELLYRNAEHSRWDDAADRCLACGNCTMVCPTCFCTAVEDVTDLNGETAERVRRWDSCFNSEFSYIHGGNVRQSIKSRYRQWLTHKLASWHDQFGSSGCVGCGRCISWCPVAIDITEEVAAIRNTDIGAAASDSG